MQFTYLLCTRPAGDSEDCFPAVESSSLFGILERGALGVEREHSGERGHAAPLGSIPCTTHGSPSPAGAVPEHHGCGPKTR